MWTVPGFHLYLFCHPFLIFFFFFLFRFLFLLLPFLHFPLLRFLASSTSSSFISRYFPLYLLTGMKKREEKKYVSLPKGKRSHASPPPPSPPPNPHPASLKHIAQGGECHVFVSTPARPPSRPRPLARAARTLCLPPLRRSEKRK